MALPAMRARPRRGISSSTWSRCVRISISGRVGRVGADEQGRNYRVRTDSVVAGSHRRSAAAPDCIVLQRIATPGTFNGCLRRSSSLVVLAAYPERSFHRRRRRRAVGQQCGVPDRSRERMLPPAGTHAGPGRSNVRRHYRMSSKRSAKPWRASPMKIRSSLSATRTTSIFCSVASRVIRSAASSCAMNSVLGSCSL
jgi:hypothetical protein